MAQKYEEEKVGLHRSSLDSDRSRSMDINSLRPKTVHLQMRRISKEQASKTCKPKRALQMTDI